MFEAVSVNREITGQGANILLCADGSVPLSGVLADMRGRLSACTSIPPS